MPQFGDLTGRVAEQRAAAVKAGNDRISIDAEVMQAIRSGLPDNPSGRADALAALTAFVRSLSTTVAA
jgi:hypothetical protein